MKAKLEFTIAAMAFGAAALLCPAAELTYTTRANTMEWFEGARFGIFVHWDARSNWSRDDGRYNVDVRPEMKRAQEEAVWGDARDAGGKAKGRKRWQEWDPRRFDADAWVRLFLQARARYVTFTTMHMWAQSNFDHPSSRFDVMSTRYGKDLAAQLARAAAGKLPVMWYYNMYPSKHVQGERAAYFKTFLHRRSTTWDEFRKAGIHELVRNTARYGKVAGIWCDGGGTFRANPINRDFYAGMKQAQPWLVFSPRCGHSEVPKDWRVPEQRMPRMDWRTHQEMTLPIESSLWFWAQGKRENTKDAVFCLRTLIAAATRDANLLLNISPEGDGRIDAYQQEILRAIGRWLAGNGAAVFETRGGPYEPGTWGGSTRRGKTVFLHLTQLSEDGTYTLPPLPSPVRTSRMFDGEPVTVEQGADKLVIRMAPALATNQDVIDRIVELQLADDAWRMLPDEAIPTGPGAPLAAKATASSENRYKRPSGKTAGNPAANVTDPKQRAPWSASEPWSKAGADPNPWLMLDLGEAKAIREVFVQEHHSRVRQYVVEHRKAATGPWTPIISGGRLNYLSYRMARPTPARFVRIRFPQTQGGAPQVSRFEVYASR